MTATEAHRQAQFERLLDAYARAAECQLATYEGLLLVKSSSKSSLRRHRALCVSMLAELTLLESQCVRVAQVIDRRHMRVQQFLAQELSADQWLVTEEGKAA